MPPLAVAELLRGVIGAYKESFKAAALSDSAVFQNYALAALVVDEACKEVRGRLDPLFKCVYSPQSCASLGALVWSARGDWVSGLYHHPRCPLRRA